MTNRGMSLVEVLVALALLILVVLGLAQVFQFSGRANAQGRNLTMASVLAQQKLEQLRGLAWTFDASGARISDAQTNTAAMPELPAGGTGLQASPAGTLETSAAGYCDFLDIHGRILGGGASPPADAAWVRRWSIQPLADDPVDTLVLRVRLLSKVSALHGQADPAGITVTTVRTRTAS